MNRMLLAAVVTVFACGEYFILESNTQDDANHAPMIKPAAVEGITYSAKFLTCKGGKVRLVVVACNNGKSSEKKLVRVFLQETRSMAMARIPSSAGKATCLPG